MAKAFPAAAAAGQPGEVLTPSHRAREEGSARDAREVLSTKAPLTTSRLRTLISAVGPP
jgi:hypothetical protein